jgi:tetratricopeptide (TPR) repeat protein
MASPNGKSAVVGAALWVVAAGCGRVPPATSTPPSGNASATANAGIGGRPPRASAIPSEHLNAVLAADRDGLGYMERFDYGKAVNAYRKAHELAPDWVPGSVNLAIALLNGAGAEEEARKQKGKPASGGRRAFEDAVNLLDSVLEREPDNVRAHYCRGLILQALGPADELAPDPRHPHRLAEAHEDFLEVTRRDPHDAHAWYYAAHTTPDPDNPDAPATSTRKRAADTIRLYSKALELDPFLVPAIYELSRVYIINGKRKEYDALAARFMKVNPENKPWLTGVGEITKSYGDMGRYSRVIELPRPGREPGVPLVLPRFAAPARLVVQLRAGERWVTESDFTGGILGAIGRARARFGPAVATFDADGDRQTDIFMAAAILGPDGPRDALLLNKGDGHFEEAAAKLGVPNGRASLGAAAGDFDADGYVDLFLTGVGDNRLLRNLGPKRGFEDVTKVLPSAGPPAVSLTARWLDLDQDGDLDLYVLNYTAAANADEAFTDRAPAGLANSAFRNDGEPMPVPGKPKPALAPPALLPGTEKKPERGLSLAFVVWPLDANADLLGGATRHTAVAALDLDDDRDLDLLLAADGTAPLAVLNDRLGRFHAEPLKDLEHRDPISALCVLDLDGDERPDLAAIPARGRVTLWHNQPATVGPARSFRFEFWPTDASDWRSAVVADLDLDGTPDLVGCPAPGAADGPQWAANERKRLATRAVPLGPDASDPLQALAYSDLVGDALPDMLLVRQGQSPGLARNLGNGHHWIALELSGRWHPGPQDGPMRTNAHGLGTRILVQGPGLSVAHIQTTPEAGPAQSVGPVVLGIGQSQSAALVRAVWPDAVMQCELNVQADHLKDFHEICRKTGSCPVLFTWDGERFVCIGDFLGGGGLGVLVRATEYGQPDRDEALAIAPDQLREIDGRYHLAITEPMDELAYIDRLILDVIDRPQGVDTVLDERFAPAGNRPTGRIIAYTEKIEPVKASDLDGDDLAETLLHWDRKTADNFRKLSRWTGYAEEHGIVLDFGDRLAKMAPTDPVVLCLAGWVEYPYSQTNYAAATAGVQLNPPVLERQRPDGSWEVIEPEPGYPAGMPRMTSLDVTGKLVGPRCMVRLRTNMECYWDQAFLALPIRDPSVRVTSLEVARAVLRDRGYTREVSPDGRMPMIYDYDHVDPAPLARLAGSLTRYGDVAPLLRHDDDQLCLVGPGDEVRLEFDAHASPTLPAGWSRSYVLRAIGYCKDSDPFTAASDTVEPLPWQGMKQYPFGPDGERPQDASYRAYLRHYQTRTVGGPKGR